MIYPDLDNRSPWRRDPGMALFLYGFRIALIGWGALILGVIVFAGLDR